MTFATRLTLLLVALLTASRASAVEFPNSLQPQLAATDAGRVYVAFGRGPEIFVARSDDHGTRFAAPVRVAALPSLMLGRRRGPRIAAHGDRVTVTTIAGELLAFCSKDGGKTWAGPSVVNDAPRSAREGLHGFSAATDGRLFAVWLDLRDAPGARTQLYGAESADGGTTWSANFPVYRAPAGQSVCECCHPSARFNARGELTVMWRNSIDGSRDMWSATRAAGARAFGPAAKLGLGTWPLRACAMDGGAIFHEHDQVATIWQRAGSIYLQAGTGTEKLLGTGTQPVAVATATRTVAVWQQGADLMSSALRGAVSTLPVVAARDARFPALLAVPGTDRILVAFEHGSDTVVTALTDSPP